MQIGRMLAWAIGIAVLSGQAVFSAEPGPPPARPLRWAADAEGPGGIAAFHVTLQVFLDAAPAEKHLQLQQVFKEAEARVQSYQKEVIAKLEELNPGQKFTPEDLSKMAHNSADPKQAEMYKKYLTARNRIYEVKLTELQELKNAYANASSEAERMSIAAQINAKQSEGLYFASEAYQTSGSILSVVQNAQKAIGNAFDPAAL